MLRDKGTPDSPSIESRSVPVARSSSSHAAAWGEELSVARPSCPWFHEQANPNPDALKVLLTMLEMQ